MVKVRTRVSGVVLSGPLAPFREAFKPELTARGYTPQTVVHQLHQVGRLSRWLQQQALTGTELDERRVEEIPTTKEVLKAQSHREQRLAQRQLGLGVLAPLALHAALDGR